MNLIELKEKFEKRIRKNKAVLLGTVLFLCFVIGYGWYANTFNLTEEVLKDSKVTTTQPKHKSTNNDEKDKLILSARTNSMPLRDPFTWTLGDEVKETETKNKKDITAENKGMKQTNIYSNKHEVNTITASVPLKKYHKPVIKGVILGINKIALIEVNGQTLSYGLNEGNSDFTVIEISNDVVRLSDGTTWYR